MSLYEITNIGCDDETYNTFDLTEDECASYYRKHYPDYDLELVVFKLVEMKDDESEDK